MSHIEHLACKFDHLGQLGYQQRRQIMKWLISILTLALTATGCMLETPDPCEGSPIGCDVTPYTAPAPKPSQPSITPSASNESITISYGY